MCCITGEDSFRAVFPAIHARLASWQAKPRQPRLLCCLPVPLKHCAPLRACSTCIAPMSQQLHAMRALALHTDLIEKLADSAEDMPAEMKAIHGQLEQYR